nr:NADH-ubiquinone oxidoreductase chain 2 [Tanacetum cinerariifolium]
EQQIFYDENSDLETVLHKPSVGHSMFEGWMKMNKLYPTARELTYTEFPTKMLLNSAKGCRTHDEIKKVNEVVYPTYKEACYAAGLLEDDKEYIECIKDAARWAIVEHLRELFVTLLSQKELTMPWSVWLQTWHLLAGDVQFKRRQILKKPGQGGVYFVYSYGGTGKTFLWKTLAVGIRRKGDIVLNVASSDRNLRDILHRTRYDTRETPFGNMTMVFGGDFKQVLLVIPKGSRQDIVNAYLNQSYLWDHCKVLKLTANMRLTVGASPEDVCKIRYFAEWILKVEDGELGEANDEEVSIDVPEELLIDTVDDPVTSIIDFTYPNLLNNINNPSYFQEKAILAPTNEVVDTINDHLLNKFSGEEMVYLSCDSIDKTERGFAVDEAVFSPEFINGLKFLMLQTTDLH